MNENERATRDTRLSRGLRHLGGMAAGPRTAAVVAGGVTVWLIVYALRGFPEWMAIALQTAAAAVTLVVVFVIQHAQRRTEAAIQLKLDALIRASDADDALAEIERAEGDELERRRERQSHRVG
jgi:low affinity Fe/Cu permease